MVIYLFGFEFCPELDFLLCSPFFNFLSDNWNRTKKTIKLKHETIFILALYQFPCWHVCAVSLFCVIYCPVPSQKLRVLSNDNCNRFAITIYLIKSLIKYELLQFQVQFDWFLAFRSHIQAHHKNKQENIYDGIYFHNVCHYVDNKKLRIRTKKKYIGTHL